MLLIKGSLFVMHMQLGNESNVMKLQANIVMASQILGS